MFAEGISDYSREQYCSEYHRYGATT
jgi:hypothetical protein